LWDLVDDDITDVKFAARVLLSSTLFENGWVRVEEGYGRGGTVYFECKYPALDIVESLIKDVYWQWKEAQIDVRYERGTVKSFRVEIPNILEDGLENVIGRTRPVSESSINESAWWISPKGQEYEIPSFSHQDWIEDQVINKHNPEFLDLAAEHPDWARTKLGFAEKLYDGGLVQNGWIRVEGGGDNPAVEGPVSKLEQIERIINDRFFGKTVSVELKDNNGEQACFNVVTQSDVEEYGLSHMMRAGGGLQEAMENDKFGYKSVRKGYVQNDPNPNVIILDPRYPPNKPDSKLCFNLNYLEAGDKAKLIREIQKYDDKILGIKEAKAFIASTLNKGFYPKGKKLKIRRYQDLISKFPVLKKTIRRYRYQGISR
jgi:hypothetical protein